MTNNKIIIITGPSASGKTSLTDALLVKYKDKLDRIKTITTRPQRSDSDEESYDFVNEKFFRYLIKENLLLEFEEVYPGCFYGTHINSIRESLNSTNIVKNSIICLDVNGAWKLKKILGNRCITVFCNPGSWDVIQYRLKKRNQDGNLQERILKYNFEMSLKDNFDIEMDTSNELEITLNNFQHEVFDIIKKNTLIVNFYGGPGSGKSTMAASIFSELKHMGINCELVTEYAKDKVWEESFSTLNDQLYIVAKQYHRIAVLLNKVDVIITDSPLLNSLAYTSPSDTALTNLVKEYHFKNYNLDIFLNRTKEFNPKGRVQTYEESLEKDKIILNILDTNLVTYSKFNGERDSIDLILKQILQTLKK